MMSRTTKRVLALVLCLGLMASFSVAFAANYEFYESSWTPSEGFWYVSGYVDQVNVDDDDPIPGWVTYSVEVLESGYITVEAFSGDAFMIISGGDNPDLTQQGYEMDQVVEEFYMEAGEYIGISVYYPSGMGGGHSARYYVNLSAV